MKDGKLGNIIPISNTFIESFHLGAKLMMLNKSSIFHLHS